MSIDRRSFIKTGAAAVGGMAFGLSRRPALADMQSCDVTISGDFAGTVPAGEVWRISGDVNLTGDLVVEGTLTGGDTFTVEGNGHQILFQHGGRADLAGMPKTAWCRWGDGPVGWQIGDRLSVAPSVVGVYVPTQVVWQGSWAATSRPPSSPDVTLIDGSVHRPEVANLSQTARIHNVSRVMFHHGAGVQRLAHLNVQGAGIRNEEGFYPIHFHLNGETVRGSTLTGVVVEDGKFRAFVPHASHGITFDGCAAVGVFGEAYWWDPPPNRHWRDTTNDSNDIAWVDCLTLDTEGGYLHEGFTLGRGLRNSCVGCVATAVRGIGTRHVAGAFAWPEDGAGMWEFDGCVAHNNDAQGSFVWRNDNAGNPHDISNFIAYHNYSDLRHGAYRNGFQYRQVVAAAVHVQAVSTLTRPVIFEDMQSEHIRIGHHNVRGDVPTVFRRCKADVVSFDQSAGLWSIIWFEDSEIGLFDMSTIHSSSIVEVYQDGVLTDRWTEGAWQ